MDAEPRLEWERQLLERGDDRAAAQLLKGTLKESETLGPDEIEAIRELAGEARSRTGLLGKRRWNRILRLADGATKQASASRA